MISWTILAVLVVECQLYHLSFWTRPTKDKEEAMQLKLLFFFFFWFFENHLNYSIDRQNIAWKLWN